MHPEPLSPKDIFRDIVSMSWSLPYFFDKGKEYEPLARFIYEKKYDIEVGDWPQIKDILKETGLQHSKFTKYLKSLYQDLREEEDFKMEFLEIKYRIWISSQYSGGVMFDLTNLPVVPRIGEKMDIPYFQEFIGRTSFHVKDVRHRLRNGYQMVEIELAEGDYNLFWHLRLDEAIAREEIHWREVFDKTTDQLKDKLEVTPKWRRNSKT